ncbi:MULTISPECIES: FecR domain-containing protein [unclassified Novosphingobium]|uniref:FecR family protein n=1 Tax=unclassified Novosphingobium TaxID=2644732 RepID=UPI001357AE54|nr:MULTISPECIES: FecR domain-containing protein [unclassified Novosphingobium]
MQGLAENTMREEAIAWHLRLNGSVDADWDDFARWLELDPRHNDIYEAVCDADLAFEQAAGLTRSTSPEAGAGDDAFAMPQPRPARRWMWPAMAASVAFAALGTWAMMGGQANEYTVQTAPGETRTLALSDGTRIVLNGATEIALDKSDTRVAQLKAGEAQFTVHHDDARPFTLSVGDQRIVDVGTVFNVRSGKGALRLEVAEGAVRFEDGMTRLRLNAGDTLETTGSSIVEGAKPVGEIGGWTRGRLVYRDTLLVEVAADITRTRGIAIELGPDVSDRRFSGVIQLDGGDGALQKRIEALLGVKVTATADGWSITR